MHNARDKVTRARLRENQHLLFQQMVSLLDRTNADAMLLREDSDRRQTFSRPIQPLLNALRQQGGEVLIASHESILPRGVIRR